MRLSAELPAKRSALTASGKKSFSSPLDTSSALVENALGDATLTDLAPLPPFGAKKFVKMLVSDSDAAKPDLCLALADPLELRATSEVQQIGCPGSLSLALGDSQVTVKDESDGLQTRFPEVLG
jgi:hypothetical protein